MSVAVVVNGKKQWRYPKTCARCGQDFLGGKPTTKFCSHSCASTRPRSEIRVDNPTYRAVHSRLNRWRGNAKQFLCGCGERATQWAFDNNPVDALVSPSGAIYSTDLSRYTPMCALCHHRMDRTHTHCKRGHEFIPENIYIRPGNGYRMCRQCQQMRIDARKDRMRAAQP